MVGRRRGNSWVSGGRRLLVAACLVVLLSALRANASKSAESGTSLLGVSGVGVGLVAGIVVLVCVLVRIQVASLLGLVGVARRVRVGWLLRAVVVHVVLASASVRLPELVQDRSRPLGIDS